MSERYFPAMLKEHPIWVLWRLEERDGRMTKVPYSAKYNGCASSTNPNTWSTYEQVCEQWAKHPNTYNGLGVMISTAYRLIFIDIDHCFNPETGGFSETAEYALNLFPDQYQELSQSGTGVHILALGDIPRSFKNSCENVEMYHCARFCALTGNTLNHGTPHEQQDAITAFFQRYRTPEQVPSHNRPRRANPSMSMSDEAIIARARRHGIKFSTLYDDGDYCRIGLGSQSEADLVLCIILMDWCNRDYEQVDRIFRCSALCRPKWENRSDYRERTLAAADNAVHETLAEKDEREANAFARAFFGY